MSARFIRPVSPFVAATIAPVPLLVLGAFLGSVFIVAAFLYLTAFMLVLDRLIHTAGRGAAPGVEFPAADRLSEALAILHFPLLFLGVAAVSGETGLGFWEGLCALFAFGLFFGQVSNSNAHELIHRTGWRLHTLGKWVLISLLYGHHVTAHLRIHHRYVATPDDPNSARRGEGFYAFAVRAWTGAFQSGWEIENAIATVKGRRLKPWEHPYGEYILGGLGFALACLLLFGMTGLIAFVLLALHAQLQLLLSDYVQHYGLRRRRLEGDRYEPVAPWHSWNAPHWFSSGLMLNATRHSEHHTNPARPYPELSLPDAGEGPRLPYSLPAMGAIALVPPIWRELMDRRAREWQARIDAGTVQRTRPPPPTPAPRPAPASAPASASASAPARAAPARTARPATGAAAGTAAATAAATARAMPDEDPEAFALAVGALARAEARPPKAPAEEPDAPVTRAMTPAAAVALSRNAAQAREIATVMGEPELLSAELLRRIRESEPVLPDEVAERKRRAAELARQRAPTPALWSDPEAERAAEDAAEQGDEQPDAPAGSPAARFIRSAALFNLDGGARRAGAPAATVPHDPPLRRRRDLAAEQAAIDHAISEVVAAARKESRRLRAKLPTLEPAGDGREPDAMDQLRYLAAGARLAARALANVLRGAPSAPPGDDDRDFDLAPRPLHRA